MGKIALLSFGVVVAFGLAGAALADTMAETYGNTLLATNLAGETTKFLFKDDGTYTFVTAKGEHGSGKWAIKSGKYCSTDDLPATAAAGTPAPKEACLDYQPNHKVGDKWTQNGSDGKAIIVEIKAGT